MIKSKVTLTDLKDERTSKKSILNTGSKTNIVIAGVLLVVIIMLASVSFYFYNEYSKLKNNPENVEKEEVEQITSMISEYMELPKDETPSVATVVDKEKINDQPFFANAENGDKIIIYAQAKKAILWRPSINKIIEVAPLFFQENQQVSPTP